GAENGRKPTLEHGGRFVRSGLVRHRVSRLPFVDLGIHVVRDNVSARTSAVARPAGHLARLLAYNRIGRPGVGGQILAARQYDRGTVICTAPSIALSLRAKTCEGRRSLVSIACASSAVRSRHMRQMARARMVCSVTMARARGHS